MTTTTLPTAPHAPGLLRARSAAFALLARMLGPDPSGITSSETVAALRIALGAADPQAATRLDQLDAATLPDQGQLAGRWVRWCELGRVAPYEGSNVATTVGGITPRLADVAGFYRAFGMAVSGDRPDHIVAQLEFLALVLLAEAEAIERGDPERSQIAADATRSFLRDHVGVWIYAWAARVGEIDELAPWFPYAAAAADLTRSEAANRNVIPLCDGVALPADAGVADDADAVIECGDEGDSPD